MRKQKPTGRRFIFEDRTLSVHEALIQRAKDLQRLRDEITALAAEPLPTTRCFQVEVQPDDPRYEDAPIAEVWVHYEPHAIKCNTVRKAKQ